MAHPQPDPEKFVASPLNQPFWPTDERSATEILQDYEPGAGASGSEAELSDSGAKCKVCGEAGVRKLAAQVSAHSRTRSRCLDLHPADSVSLPETQHFHHMEGLREVECEMQRKGIKHNTGKTEEVEVILV